MNQTKPIQTKQAQAHSLSLYDFSLKLDRSKKSLLFLKLTTRQQVQINIRLSLLLVCLISLPVLTSTAHAAKDQTKAGFASIELHARRVDRVALESQDGAAKKLKSLIRQYRGKRQEPILMMRLAQVFQEGASIEFRIASHKKPSSTQLANYKKRLGSTISTLNGLLGRFPHFQKSDQALFIRAQAKQELEDLAGAKRDYLALTSQFPESNHTLASYMALATMSSSDNHHAEAVSYLNPILAHPDSPQYPFALYQLAWSHFNLEQIPKALDYLKKHISFLDPRQKKLGSSDTALRENSLVDVATFYFEGFERMPAEYPIDSALEQFEKLRPGDILDRMNVRLAKLLRSRRREPELIQFKDQLIAKKPKMKGTMDVVLTLFDHQWNQNQLPQMITSLKDIRKIYQSSKTESSSRKPPMKPSELRQISIGEDEDPVLANLAQKAEKLQASVIKNSGVKNSESNPKLQLQMQTLSEIYSTLIQILPPSDPKIAIAHYNLAETLFRISKFELATEHYRWILDHWNSRLTFTRPSVELKAIASRYEELRKENAIPTHLTAAALDNSKWSDYRNSLKNKGARFERLIQWVDWIDSFSGKKTEDLASLETFMFEANRTLYSLGGISASIARLKNFATNHPGSELAVKSQQLILDSYIVNGDWEKTLNITQDFKEQRQKFHKKAQAKNQIKNKKQHNPLESEFDQTLDQLAADSTYKLLEALYQRKQVAGKELDQRKIQLSHKVANSKGPNSDHTSQKNAVESALNQYEDLSEQFDLSAQDYLKKYSSHPRAPDVLLLLATASEQAGDSKGTLNRLGELLKKHPKSSQAGQALLTRAGLELQSYQWNKASDDYEAYLASKNSSPEGAVSAQANESAREKIWSQALVLRWILGRPTLPCDKITQNLDSPIGVECLRFQALETLRTGPKVTGSNKTGGLDLKMIDRLALKGDHSNRSLWALVSLKWTPSMSIRNQLRFTKTVARYWSQLSPEVRLTTVPDVGQQIAKALKNVREGIKRANPMNRPSPRAVTLRAEWIKELENTVTQVQKLPWYRIQANSMMELAQAYDEFISNLLAAKMPKELSAEEQAQYTQNIQELVAPFSKKRDSIAEHSIQMGLQAQIEKTDLDILLGRFPDLTAKVKKNLSKNPSHKHAAHIAGAAQGQSMFKTLLGQIASKQKNLPALKNWRDGYQTQSWAKCAVLLQEISSKNLLPSHDLKILRAATLAAQGAQSEAFVELEGLTFSAEGKTYEL